MKLINVNISFNKNHYKIYIIKKKIFQKTLSLNQKPKEKYLKFVKKAFHIFIIKKILIIFFSKSYKTNSTIN